MCLEHDFIVGINHFCVFCMCCACVVVNVDLVTDIKSLCSGLTLGTCNEQLAIEFSSKMHEL